MSAPFFTTTTGNPEQSKFPNYMFRQGKEPDSAIAKRSRQLLDNNNKITFEKFSQLAFDSYLPNANDHIKISKRVE